MKQSDDKTKKRSKSPDRRPEQAPADRFFRFCVTMIALLVGGLCGVAFWAYRELSRERSYQQQYGPDWKSEFEKTYGLIAHIHTQIGVCALGLLALTSILIWLCLQSYQQRAREKFTYHSV